MRFDRIALHGAAVAIAMMSAAAARADNSATGLWIDHTGRGAVEITECNGKLCGHVAWVQDAKNSDQCGKQIIGNVKSVGKNKWDNGWIYDPDRGSKYDVELTAIGADGTLAWPAPFVTQTGADCLVACDGACLMQMGGGLSRRNSRVRALHLAQVLAGDGA